MVLVYRVISPKVSWCQYTIIGSRYCASHMAIMGHISERTFRYFQNSAFLSPDTQIRYLKKESV